MSHRAKFLAFCAAAAFCAVRAAAEEQVVWSTAALSADNMDYLGLENTVVARGNAVLASSNTRMEADQIILNLSSHTADASGHVALTDQGLSVLADSIFYDWSQSSGTLKDAYVENGPWRIWAKKIRRVDKDTYLMESVALTNCDETPPHYHFRASKAKFIVGKKASLKNVRPTMQQSPVFYVPYYSKSLEKHRWHVTIDPGKSARNGLMARTAFIYPTSDHTRLRLGYDYYQFTGNGYSAEFAYSTDTVRGAVSGYSISDRQTKTHRWDVHVGHWQKLSRRLSVQSNVAFQSDTNVNDTFIRDDYTRVRQVGESDLALTYQHSKYTGRLLVAHDRAFDPVQNHFVEQKTTLPELSFQTSPLAISKTKLFLTMNGNFKNEYIRPSTGTNPNPIYPDKDLYRQTGSGSLDLRRHFRVTKDITLEPDAGFSEQWQSWQDLGTTIDPADLTQGRGFTNVNWRHRLGTSLEYDITHRYTVRWRPNSFSRDHASNPDRGIEQNNLNLLISLVESSAFWARANSGYDLRTSTLTTIHSAREKITPPSFEMYLRTRNNLTYSVRETVMLYPTRKPQSSLFNVFWGYPSKTHLSTGFSYNVGRPGELDVNQSAGFALTKGWWVDGDVQYTASGPGGVRYDHVAWREKNLSVRRDMHCWVLRVNYKERPGVNEVFFRFDLKTNFDEGKKLALPDEHQFHPARDDRENY